MREQEIIKFAEEIQTDRIFLELLRLPLFLSVFFNIHKAQADRDGNPRILSTKALKAELLRQYLLVMLQVHGMKSPWSPKQLLLYLRVLAQRMRSQYANVFSFDDIQPEWLSGRMIMRIYQIFSWMIGAVGGGVVLSILAVSIFDKPVDYSVIHGAVYGPGMGLFLSLVIFSRRIENVMTLRWRWCGIRKHGVILLVIMLVHAELFLRLFEFSTSIGVAVRFFVLLGGFLNAIWVDGLIRDQIEDIDYPSEAMLRSAKNALIAAIASGSLFGLMLGIVLLAQGELSVGISIFYGASTGLFIAANFGGYPMVIHLTLRAILIFSNEIPLRLVLFLNAMAECNLLYRVGGGYIFTHNLLRDYCSALTDVEIDELAAEVHSPQRTNTTHLAA